MTQKNYLSALPVSLVDELQEKREVITYVSLLQAAQTSCCHTFTHPLACYHIKQIWH